MPSTALLKVYLLSGTPAINSAPTTLASATFIITLSACFTLSVPPSKFIWFACSSNSDWIPGYISRKNLSFLCSLWGLPTGIFLVSTFAFAKSLIFFKVDFLGTNPKSLNASFVSSICPPAYSVSGSNFELKSIDGLTCLPAITIVSSSSRTTDCSLLVSMSSCISSALLSPLASASAWVPVMPLLATSPLAANSKIDSKVLKPFPDKKFLVFVNKFAILLKALWITLPTGALLPALLCIFHAWNTYACISSDLVISSFLWRALSICITSGPKVFFTYSGKLSTLPAGNAVSKVSCSFFVNIPCFFAFLIVLCKAWKDSWDTNCSKPPLTWANSATLCSDKYTTSLASS